MNATRDNLFYTKDHDWILFTGAVAYIGVANFKLTGIPMIDDISLFGYKTGDLVHEGTLLLNIHYREYVIPVNAPTTCTFLRMNIIIDNGSWDLITDDPEGKGWLFRVEPRLEENSHLLHPTTYKKQLPYATNGQP